MDGLGRRIHQADDGIGASCYLGRRCAWAVEAVWGLKNMAPTAANGPH